MMSFRNAPEMDESVLDFMNMKNISYMFKKHVG